MKATYERRMHSHHIRDPIQCSCTQNFLIFELLANGVVPEAEQCNVWVIMFIILLPDFEISLNS